MHPSHDATLSKQSVTQSIHLSNGAYTIYGPPHRLPVEVNLRRRSLGRLGSICAETPAQVDLSGKPKCVRFTEFKSHNTDLFVPYIFTQKTFYANRSPCFKGWKMDWIPSIRTSEV